MKWPADRKWRWTEVSRRLSPPQLDDSLRLAVLAAHPDDETIGASCLLSHLSEPMVVYLTDGAPRDTRFWSPAVRGSRIEYAAIRQTEAKRALAHAGISERQIVFLGGVDQEAIFEVCNLARSLVEVLEAYRTEVLLTHAYEGGHPDHDAAALIASMACSRTEQKKRPELLEMTSYHARRGQCVTGEFLHPDLATEIRFELAGEDHMRKRQMIGEYVSQRLVLENFPLEAERIRPALAYDFSKPPHEGKLWYECMGWPLEGKRWRELAVSALSEIREQACR